MRTWLSQIRQRPSLGVYAGLLILVIAAIGGASIAWLSSSSSDRVAVIGNFLALGTLLLALVAGIVALAAYTAATGLPDLKVQFITPRGEINWARFVPDADASAVGNTAVVIAVKNVSSYAARVPAVIVEFQGAVIRERQSVIRQPWTPIKGYLSQEIASVQWDGGPNYSIHGDSTRYLPELDLHGLRPLGGDTDFSVRILVRLLADGYTRDPGIVPVEFTHDQSGPGSRDLPPWWL